MGTTVVGGKAARSANGDTLDGGCAIHRRRRAFDGPRPSPADWRTACASLPYIMRLRHDDRRRIHSTRSARQGPVLRPDKCVDGTSPAGKRAGRPEPLPRSNFNSVRRSASCVADSLPHRRGRRDDVLNRVSASRSPPPSAGQRSGVPTTEESTTARRRVRPAHRDAHPAVLAPGMRGRPAGRDFLDWRTRTCCAAATSHGLRTGDPRTPAPRHQGRGDITALSSGSIPARRS
jgi:hypothetical protein